MPLRHVSALPLVFRGATVGVIYVFRAALNVEFTAEEHQLLTAFADQAAIAVSNARLFQSVLREKQHLDALIENSADGVMILDERWRIATFNRAMELLTGWSREEAIGRPCAEVLAIHTPQGANLCLTDCPLQRQPFEPNPGRRRVDHNPGMDGVSISRVAMQRSAAHRRFSWRNCECS